MLNDLKFLRNLIFSVILTILIINHIKINFKIFTWFNIFGNFNIRGNNNIFTLHFYFTITLKIFEKYEFLLSYINFKEPQFIILLFAVYIVYIAIINPDIVHYAFRLFYIIKAKTPYAISHLVNKAT